MAITAASGAGLSAKSYKRGVSENQFSISGQMTPLAPGVSWYYNWGNTPGKGYQGQVIGFDGFDFIPMTWNANYDADAIREYARSHPGCKYILGFNEPNFKKQAKMTPQEAAAQWPAVVALARELGLKIVAPALNYSPDAPYTQPSKWMDEFVELVGLDSFDFVAIHNYGGLGVMKQLGTEFHEKYGKPVWVTEFCYWPNEGSPTSRVEPEVQIASMVESVEWLEKTEWIYRYAWFKPIGNHENTDTQSSPCFGLLISENGIGEKKLSPQGMVYTYMTDFNPGVWHQEGEEVPASEYIQSSLISLAPGSRADAPKPIEISKFNSGAWVDYQFDVKSDGDYLLRLSVTGHGEPARFDPVLGLESVNADGSTQPLLDRISFPLPGNESDYITQDLGITLKAGKQTLRLIDRNPYQPSGIRISTVTLVDKEAGVEEVETPDYGERRLYSIDGRRVLSETPDPGIYIETKGGKSRTIFIR